MGTKQGVASTPKTTNGRQIGVQPQFYPIKVRYVASHQTRQ